MRAIVLRFLAVACIPCASCSRSPVISSSGAPSDSPIRPAGATDRDRRLEFTTVSLEHLARHFAETSGRRITVAPEVADMKLGGSMHVDSLDGFLRLISKLPNLQVEISKDGSIHIAPKSVAK